MLGAKRESEWPSLWFETEQTDWALELALDVGAFVCIDPYASLVLNSPIDVAPFEIAGMSLVCELVKVTVSEPLIDDGYFITSDLICCQVWFYISSLPIGKLRSSVFGLLCGILLVE